MIARVRKSLDERDGGFTLIELLVVIVIIGVLASIAIPVFMNQRKKAYDAQAVADVSTLGKEVATYYVDATAILAPATGVALGTGTDAGQLMVNGGPVGPKSAATSGVALKYYTTAGAAAVSSPAPTVLANAQTQWCVELTYANGTNTTVSYSAKSGLSKTAGCV